MFGAIAPSAQARIAIVRMVQFPMMFLSGALFPLDFLPEFSYPIAVVLPLTYLAAILHQIIVEATPYASIMQELVIVPLFLLASALFSWRFFR